MRGWMIFFGIILLIFAIGTIRLNFIIKYKKDFSLTLKIFFFGIPLVPGKPKRVKLFDYTPEKIKKREEKEAKRKEKKLQKKKKKEEQKQKGEKKPFVKSFSDVTDLLHLIKEVVNKLFYKFFRYLKTEIVTLKIKIGGAEADKIAITYGVVIQTVAYIFELLDTYSNLKISQHDSCDIQPCYTEKNFSADINIVLKIRIWQVLACVFATAFTFLTSKYNNIFKIKLLSKNGGQKDGRE